ncbi:NADP-dependent oxidoreductase [Nocardia australiensis]|uniref:NADP-dependent oxidoreductase n=1 Tax=Nocardia australiensis TaxID=2887191 RepID=UPI001D13AAD8|nr:NADP-dependent oxidoreductase [Nocardia australiensis]
MKAIAFNEFGGPEVLKIVDIPAPEPGEGEVRVAVRAAGINPADWKIRSGALSFGTPSFPQYPGVEVAGVVDAVGSGVSDVAAGDEVFGWAQGGYAEFAICTAVARKPAGLAWVDAVALPVAVSTADTVLRELELRPGETLLVNGAAGAVGSMAVQLAVAAGVTVIGTASQANQDAVRSLGATPTTYGAGVADRVRAVAPNGIDAVFDAAGHGVLPAAIELRGGTDRIVTIADPAAAEFNVRFTSAGSQRPVELAERVAEGIVSGEFRLPGAARTFPLEQAAAAQQESEAGRGRGKVVVTID